MMEQQLTSSLNIETFDTLMFLDDDDNDDENDGNDEFDTDDDEEKGDPDYHASPKKGRGEWDVFTEEEMERIHTLRYSNKGRKLISFETIQSRFRKLKSEDHLKWVISKFKNKSCWQKRRQVEQFLLEKFTDATVHKCRIHNRDVKRWAMKEAKNIQYASFKCSDTWIERFKRRHRIGRRQITTFVTDRSINRNRDIVNECKEFVTAVRTKLPWYHSSKVFNTDQSGFNKELHTRHTLAFIGTRRVEARIKSQSAMTHSYTIQPLVSLDGTLHSPMLVVLQEPGGTFGPRVAQSMRQPPNLVIKASRSHIVTKQIVQDWFTEIYFPTAGNKSLLLVDALPAYKDRAVIDTLKPTGYQYEVMVVPEGGTKYVQPLDRLFFRQWKLFAKEIHDHIINEDIDINMFNRDEIITLQSLIHNQFSNERFRSYRIESWKLSGFIDSNVEFENPVKFCFNLTGDCSTLGCGGYSMIKCSYCEREFCFQHFFIDNHAHFVDQ